MELCLFVCIIHHPSMFLPWLNLANKTIYTHHTSVMSLIHQRGTRHRGKAINKISNYQYTSIQCGWVGCHILNGTFHPELSINVRSDLWKASLNFHLRFSSSGKNPKFENWVFSVFIWKFFDWQKTVTYMFSMNE